MYLVIHLASQNVLVCISNGLLATEVVKSDMLGAVKKGGTAMETFAKERLGEHASVDFFQPIIKKNLQQHEKNCQICSER